MSSIPDSLWPLLKGPLKMAHQNALKIEITVYPARLITREWCSKHHVRGGRNFRCPWGHQLLDSENNDHHSGPATTSSGVKTFGRKSFFYLATACAFLRMEQPEDSWETEELWGFSTSHCVGTRSPLEILPFDQELSQWTKKFRSPRRTHGLQCSTTLQRGFFWKG